MKEGVGMPCAPFGNPIMTSPHMTGIQPPRCRLSSTCNCHDLALPRGSTLASDRPDLALVDLALASAGSGPA